MQSYDSSDRPVSKIVPVDNFEQIINELKKPDVEYVKVFMHNGFPSIKKDVPQSDMLGELLDKSLQIVNKDININDLYGKALRKELNRRG